MCNELRCCPVCLLDTAAYGLPCLHRSNRDKLVDSVYHSAKRSHEGAVYNLGAMASTGYCIAQLDVAELRNRQRPGPGLPEKAILVVNVYSIPNTHKGAFRELFDPGSGQNTCGPVLCPLCIASPNLDLVGRHHAAYAERIKFGLNFDHYRALALLMSAIHQEANATQPNDGEGTMLLRTKLRGTCRRSCVICRAAAAAIRWISSMQEKTRPKDSIAACASAA